MDTILQALGLSQKETKVYLLLLENGVLTAAEIASLSGETRTNTYMLLDALEHQDLIEIDEDRAVRRFKAASPVKLREMAVQQQQRLKQVDAELRGVLPDMMSKYRLTQHKPGVIYREGIAGLKDILEDMVRTKAPVLMIPSNIADLHQEAYVMLQKAAAKHQASGLETKALLHEEGRQWDIMKQWSKQGVQTRFIGEHPFAGEVIIYDDTCVFIEYSPDNIITTTLTNEVIAQTMAQIFTMLWESAAS